MKDLEKIITKLKAERCMFTVGGIEIGEDTGYKHSHIMIEYENARTFESIKKLFNINGNQHHIEPRKSSMTDLYKYITKPETKENKEILTIYDNMIIKDTDTMESNLIQDIINNMNWKDILQNYSHLIVRYYDNILKIYQDIKGFRKSEMIWELLTKDKKEEK